MPNGVPQMKRRHSLYTPKGSSPSAFTTDLIDEKWPFGGEIRVELKVLIKRSQAKIRAQFDALLYEGDSETTTDLDDEAHFETTIPVTGVEKKFTLINSGSGDMAEFNLVFSWQHPGQFLHEAPQLAGVWRAGGGSQHVVDEPSWNDFVAKWSSLSSSGLRLVDIEPWGDDTERSWRGIFRPASGGYALWSGDWDAFVAKDNELSQGGLNLVDFTTYMDHGARIWLECGRKGLRKASLSTV